MFVSFLPGATPLDVLHPWCGTQVFAGLDVRESRLPNEWPGAHKAFTKVFYVFFSGRS